MIQMTAGFSEDLSVTSLVSQGTTVCQKNVSPPCLPSGVIKLQCGALQVGVLKRDFHFHFKNVYDNSS